MMLVTVFRCLLSFLLVLPGNGGVVALRKTTSIEDPDLISTGLLDFDRSVHTSSSRNHDRSLQSSDDACVEDTRKLLSNSTFETAKQDFFATANTTCRRADDEVAICDVIFPFSEVTKYEDICVDLGGQAVPVPAGVVSCVFTEPTSSTKTAVFDIYNMVECISLSCDAGKVDLLVDTFGSSMLELLHGDENTSDALDRGQCTYAGGDRSATQSTIVLLNQALMLTVMISFLIFF